MKKLMFVAVAAALTGCVSVHKNDGGNEIVHPDVFTRDAVQLSYSLDQNPVSATETIHWINLGIIPITITWGGTADHVADFAPTGVKLPFVGPSIEDVAKGGAYAKALSASGADSVVATRYRIENKSYFVYGKATAEIKGLPAKITKVELSDVEKMPAKKAACPLF
ncbi:MAG: hypothetical protein E7049_02550 [Lentisphaerae bacterium]|nr:hypothetical protein [Lentisphaerota bacterium]